MAKPISKSFYDWCIENNHKDWLLLWDYELNSCSPKDISYGSGKKYWFKCPKGIHKSEEKRIDNLIRYENLKCNQCGSFGQYLVDTYGEDAIELYWDYKLNDCSPFEISKCNSKKVWIKCQKQEYHESYKVACSRFSYGDRCPCCSHTGANIHPKDSLGQILINEYRTLNGIWDFEKNGDLDPFQIYPKSGKKVWVFCQKEKSHNSYEIRCHNFYSGKRCPKCNESHGERIISKWLNDKNIKYIREKTFPNLLGIGNEPLRYDFYLPDYNLLIEYQGGQHYKPIDFKNEGLEKAEENFIKQQEHDKRKRDYADLHNIRLLEICYTDFDNIEKILNDLFKGEKNYGKTKQNE